MILRFRADLSKKRTGVSEYLARNASQKMGRDNRLEMVTMGNVMRNLLCADYLVFPNLFMEEKMADAYMLRGLYRGTVLHEGYPRNDVFAVHEGTRYRK